MGTVHKLREHQESATIMRYLGKTQKITLELPTTLLRQLDELASKRLAQHYTRNPGDRPITQAEWAIQTIEGRRFMHDCVKHKYARLSHTELRKVAKQAYLDTIETQPKKGPELKDIKAEILSEALELFNTQPVKQYKK